MGLDGACWVEEDGESPRAPRLELAAAGPADCSWSVQHVQRASDLLQALAGTALLGCSSLSLLQDGCGPQLMLKGSSSFLPPTLETPK